MPGFTLRRCTSFLYVYYYYLYIINLLLITLIFFLKVAFPLHEECRLYNIQSLAITGEELDLYCYFQDISDPSTFEATLTSWNIAMNTFSFYTCPPKKNT